MIFQTIWTIAAIVVTVGGLSLLNGIKELLYEIWERQEVISTQIGQANERLRMMNADSLDGLEIIPIKNGKWGESCGTANKDRPSTDDDKGRAAVNHTLQPSEDGMRWK